jgi:hypothetical protein
VWIDSIAVAVVIAALWTALILHFHQAAKREREQQREQQDKIEGKDDA